MKTHVYMWVFFYNKSMSFVRANFTAIISDLHICEEEPVNPKYPLWKLFKTKRFFFDDVLERFLIHIQAEANRVAQEKQIDPTVELVLNGDIFDFDSVTALPEHPPFYISWLEKKRGLYPQQEKSRYKIKKILEDHPVIVRALRSFILNKNRVVFVIGNHDLELHFEDVQDEILHALHLPHGTEKNIRFNNWFYISNQDTLVEHGNQYDPYCMCQDPINPMILKHNRLEMRLPFGNLASRYMINGMGFFNPHVDSNYIMSIPEYIHFFVKYIARAQPLLILTWFWGACVTLFQSVRDRLQPAIKDPLRIEDMVEKIAVQANATPRMVREMRDMAAPPAASYPVIIARELWLDRAFLVMIAFFGIFQLFTTIHTLAGISLYWMFIPLSLFVPFFIFYTKSIHSSVSEYKEPQEHILSISGQICGVHRVVYGHTHHIRHELIGPIEHLNSGCWSPAFLDVECTKPIYQKTYVWISPSEDPDKREAALYEFKDNESVPIFLTKN